jgi:hypothetical protein
MMRYPFRPPQLDSISEVLRNKRRMNIGGRLKCYRTMDAALGKFLREQMMVLIGKKLIGHRVFDEICERVRIHFLQNACLVGADCFYAQM